VVLTDSGFCNEAAVDQIEHNDEGQPTGITVLAAAGGKAHARHVGQHPISRFQPSSVR
jgi:hypothetical protein